MVPRSCFRSEDPTYNGFRHCFINLLLNHATNICFIQQFMKAIQQIQETNFAVPKNSLVNKKGY
jgi:hypothetical protein